MPLKRSMNPTAIFFFCACILVGIGIVMTYSTSSVYAEYVYKNPQHFLFRQMFYALFGVLLMWLTSSVPVVFWKKNARMIIVCAILFLVIVLVPGVGRTAGGAQRWINLGLIHFQPAEFAKVAVCIYLSDYLTRKRKPIQDGKLKVYLPPMIMIGMICLLTLVQPDLGSTAFIVLIVSIMIFLSGLRMGYVGAALVVLMPAFYFLVIRVPYRMSRLSAYLNPWNDPQGSGFQIIQSFLAYALGGLHGAGLGQGIQKLFYLPSSYNDFILSVIAEEMGLFGVLFIMLIYLVIFLTGLSLSQKCADPFSRLLVLALTLMIVIQALVHMLVTTGLVPTKGLPLPFVSFGGTSLLFNFMALGLVLGVDKQVNRGR